MTLKLNMNTNHSFELMFCALMTVRYLLSAGHLTAPLVAHIFCNFMGLPVMFSRMTGMSIDLS